MVKVKVEKELKNEFNKAMKKIKKNNQLGDFDFKFLQEFVDDYTAYVNNAFIGIIKGVIRKMGINPDDIKLKAKIDINDLTLCKSIEEQLRAYIEKAKGYIGDLTYEQLTEPMMIDGDFIINPETGTPLTYQDFQNITNSIYGFMSNAFGDLPSEFAVKSVILGHIMKQMDNQGISQAEQKRMSMDAVIKKFGDLPKTVEEARQRFSIKPSTGNIIKQVEARAGEKLAIPAGDIANQVIQGVKDQIVSFYRYNEANPDNKLTTKQLAGNLLYQSKQVMEKLGNKLDNATFEAWNRDWRRISRTETSIATTNAYLAEYEDEITEDSLPHFVYSGHWNPEEKADEICNCFLGETVAMIPAGDKDKYLEEGDYLKPEYAKYAKRAIWAGKTRESVGWSKKNEWVGIPSHINCFIDGRTNIFTSKGWEYIKNINEGDLVLTHNGKFKEVTNIMRGKTKKYLKIRVKSLGIEFSAKEFVSVTPEHPFLNNIGEWIPAASLKIGDKLRVLANRCKKCGELIPAFKKGNFFKELGYCCKNCSSSDVSNKMYENMSIDDKRKITSLARNIAHEKMKQDNWLNHKESRDRLRESKNTLESRKKASLCKIGNKNPMHKSNGNFEAIERMRVKKKEWAAKNPEHFKKMNAKSVDLFINNPIHREKVLEKKRKWYQENKESMQRAIFLGRLNRKNKDTRIEIKIEEELKFNEINYKKQFHVYPYTADFYLPDYNIIIECDGDYWHSLSKVQQRDKCKNELYSKLGFQVFRFTENEINKSSKKCIEEVKRVIKNHRDEYEFCDVVITDIEYNGNSNKTFTTYNFSVAEDESYIAKGFVVHNCLHKFMAIKPETQYYNKKLQVVANKTRGMK